MSKLLLTAAIAALTGCAPMIWDKPGATQADYNSDHYDCEKDVRQSGYYGGGIVGALNMRDFFRQCMTAHGYVPRQDQPATMAVSAPAPAAAAVVVAPAPPPPPVAAVSPSPAAAMPDADRQAQQQFEQAQQLYQQQLRAQPGAR